MTAPIVHIRKRLCRGSGYKVGRKQYLLGKVVEIPTIGDPNRELEIEDIPGVKLMHVSSLITLIITVLLGFGITYIF